MKYANATLIYESFYAFACFLFIALITFWLLSAFDADEKIVAMISRVY